MIDFGEVMKEREKEIAAEQGEIGKATDLLDFKRDTNKENMLFEGRWLMRGGVALLVSTTGAGKSVHQTQAAISFALGLPFLGLRPVRPMRIWVIQKEDDDDRVALDRDDILRYIEEQHPDLPLMESLKERVFFRDYSGTHSIGAGFLRALAVDLRIAAKKERLPDLIILNPWNKIIGGSTSDDKIVQSFLNGGDTGREYIETGFESLLKDYGVGAFVYAHTGKTPSPNELKAWLKDSFSDYKSHGSSLLPDSVRASLTFLPIPGSTPKTFTFVFGKANRCLGLTDENGKETEMLFARWGENGHYWEELPKDEWAEARALANGGQPLSAKPQPKPKRDDIELVPLAFDGLDAPIAKNRAYRLVMDYVNRKRVAEGDDPLPEKAIRTMLDDAIEAGKIEVKTVKIGSRLPAIMCALPGVFGSEEQKPL